MGAITIPIWLLLTLLGGSAGLAVGGKAIPLKVGHGVKVGAKKVGGVFHKCQPNSSGLSNSSTIKDSLIVQKGED